MSGNSKNQNTKPLSNEEFKKLLLEMQEFKKSLKQEGNAFPSCIPYSKAKDYLQLFHKFFYIDEDHNKETDSKFYHACKKEFAKKICNSHKYICVPEFAGDCGDSLSAPERICLSLQEYQEPPGYHIKEFHPVWDDYYYVS